VYFRIKLEEVETVQTEPLVNKGVHKSRAPWVFYQPVELFREDLGLSQVSLLAEGQ
jgi:hypothetical protein